MREGVAVIDSIELVGGPYDGETRPLLGGLGPGDRYDLMAKMPAGCATSVDPTDVSSPPPMRMHRYHIAEHSKKIGGVGLVARAIYQGEVWR